MALEEALFDLLSGNAALAALVEDRIYPVRAPQDAERPYVVFSRLDTANLATLSGRGTHDAVQLAVMCFADEDDAATTRAVARAVRQVLDGYSGDGALQAARLVGRQQGFLDDPKRHSDSLVFSILAAE